MIPKKESMTVEFKSDRKGLSDHVLVEEVVAMANSDGGKIYVGVEDDGTITGAKKEHLDPEGVRALIANQTFPATFAQAEIVKEEGMPILVIEVGVSPSIVSTSSGKTLQRRLRFDGTPEMKPLYPYEFESRRSFLRQTDPSREFRFPFEEGMIDPDSLAKALQVIQSNAHSDKTLLGLDRNSFLSALEVVTLDTENRPELTLAGLLLFGKKEYIKKLCPNARFAFVRLEGDRVLQNEDEVYDAIDAFDAFSRFLDRFNYQDEFLHRMVRYDVPFFDLDAAREGFANAIAHRDYSLLDPIRVSYDGVALTIFSPGRLIRGLTPNNLISAAPRGRNPLLSQCLKRLGLCENTGRGVDRIYASFARYGKRWPSYANSDEYGVNLVLPRSKIDAPFAGLIATQGQSLSPIPLLCLSFVRKNGKASAEEIAAALSVPMDLVLVYLSNLEKQSLLVLEDGKYSLSSLPGETPLPHALAKEEWEKRILLLAESSKEGIASMDVQSLLGTDGDKAYYLLKKMLEKGVLLREGKGKYARYFPKKD